MKEGREGEEKEEERGEEREMQEEEGEEELGWELKRLVSMSREEVCVVSPGKGVEEYGGPASPSTSLFRYYQ